MGSQQHSPSFCLGSGCRWKTEWPFSRRNRSSQSSGDLQSASDLEFSQADAVHLPDFRSVHGSGWGRPAVCRGAAANKFVKVPRPQPIPVGQSHRRHMTTRADAHTVFPILGPTRTPVVLTIDLQNQALIADIVAVNGIPAKGTYVGRTRPIISSPNPAGGGAIADVTARPCGSMSSRF